jgi:hypothetical protein
MPYFYVAEEVRTRRDFRMKARGRSEATELLLRGARVSPGTTDSGKAGSRFDGLNAP